MTWWCMSSRLGIEKMCVVDFNKSLQRFCRNRQPLSSNVRYSWCLRADKKSLLGRPLSEFIADGTTRLLYRDVLARVRGDRPVRFVLQCDSPDCRRLLEMEISRGQDGLAEFRVWTLSEDERQPQPLLDPDRPRSEELLQVCGWSRP